MATAKEKGLIGERRAAHYLIEKGYTILKLNFKSKAGEVDIIARKDDVIAFVEIKSWQQYQYENLEYAINERKKRRIIASSMQWLQQEKINPKCISYDVLYWNASYDIYHITGAFEVT